MTPANIYFGRQPGCCAGTQLEGPIPNGLLPVPYALATWHDPSLSAYSGALRLPHSRGFFRPRSPLGPMLRSTYLHLSPRVVDGL